jgi:hypothetical protein
MRVAEPRQAEVLADLLIRTRDEQHVPRRLEPFAGERGERHGARGHLALHVERATAPHMPVLHRAAPRIRRPLARVSWNRVGVRQQHQRRAVAPAAQPRDQVGPVRNPRQQLTLDPCRFEVALQELGRLRLVPRRVDGVEANQVAEELRRLLAQGDRDHAWSILSA